MSEVEPPRPPSKGGRPRKPKVAQQSEEARAIAARILQAEEHSLRAGEAWKRLKTMAAKTELMAAELLVAKLQRAWCLLAGDHTHALRWAEIVAKLSREHAAAAESWAIDEAAALAARTAAERAVAKRIGGRRAAPPRT